MKLAVFDFDSTLMDGETIEFLADELGIKDKVAEITKRAMEGELDFFESLTQRVKMLKGLPVSIIDDVCGNLPIMNGASKTVRELQKAGIIVLCFSGGFKNATEPARKVIGFDADFSNVLHSKNGVLTGLVGGEMMFSTSKGDLLERLQMTLKISPEDTMAVGDGANDLSMFKFAKTRVAFCAKEILKKEANVIVQEKDLTKILDKIVL
jgi:phosphoserine phosphatase